jgi:hypothetical protein
VHSKKEAQGDTRVATCTNCHGVHGILPHRDPASPVYAQNVPGTCAKCHNAEYMKGRAVPANQFALYRKSVHGVALLEKGDLSAPGCNACHGNHGAAPPGVKDVTQVCGTCHGHEAELFDRSRMNAAMSVQGKGGCVICHGNHGVQHPTDAMLGTGAGGMCGTCHAPGSAGEQATAAIVARFHGLRGSLALADSLLHVAELRGMETTPGREVWKDAQDRLVGGRATLHSFDPAQILPVLTEGTGLADRATGLGRGLLREWRWRRVGMVLSVGVILVLILLLALRIRRMEAA